MIKNPLKILTYHHYTYKVVLKGTALFIYNGNYNEKYGNKVIIMNTDIKLVALDLDRTTLNSESHLSEVNRQALIDAISNGVHVCIASGRAFDTLPEDVISVPGIEYAITSNGAAIYRIAGKECLKSYLLTPSSVKTILDLTANDKVTYEAFIKGQAFASTEYTAHPEKYSATEHSLAYVKKTRILKDDIVSFILEHCHELDSIDIVVGDEELKKNIMDRIRKATDEVYMTSSISQLLEMSYKDAGKKSGVKFLTEYLGLSRENVAAFGDADNDTDMIEYAGTGIAMENAAPHLKEIADHITLHHDKDGVAYAFRNILNIC